VSLYNEMKKYIFYILFSLLIGVFSCQKKITPQSYLALGDNYTVGESVLQNQSWPFQLTKVLSEKNIKISSPRIIAKTGWNSSELKIGINNSSLDFPYDWVSLLIGVNDQYQGRNIEEFKEQFEVLLAEAISFSGNKKERVFAVSIPDWAVMPFAKELNREQISKEIDDFNQVIYEVCSFENIHFIDITSISRSVKDNPSFIAKDSLHPSGTQYSRWIKQMIPFFLNRIDD